MEPLAQSSSANGTLDRFTSFKNANLTEQPSKVVAELFYSVWNGAVAEELKLRAVEDLSSQQPVPWLKYLAKLDDAEEPTLLQTLYLEYQQSVMAKPAPIATGVSAVGDEVADCTADERGKLAIVLHDLRVTKSKLLCIATGSPWRPAMVHEKFGSSVGQRWSWPDVEGR